MKKVSGSEFSTSCMPLYNYYELLRVVIRITKGIDLAQVVKVFVGELSPYDNKSNLLRGERGPFREVGLHLLVGKETTDKLLETRVISSLSF